MQHDIIYCIQCGLSLQDGRCEACLKKRVCIKCGVLLAEGNWLPSFKKRGIGKCNKCHQALCDDWESRHLGHATKRSARWRERNPDHGKEYYAKHIEEAAERNRNRLWKYKQQAIAFLGGKCVVCGITDMRILQINHVNGGGSKENMFGEAMYKAIIQGTRIIEDLDVRCANHNLLYEYESGRRRTPSWFIEEEVPYAPTSIAGYDRPRPLAAAQGDV
jgi:hypothetical protein